MSNKVNDMWLSDKFIVFLFLISMLLAKDIKVIGFPVYSLLLFLTASVWTMAGVFVCLREGLAFGTIRYWSDLMILFVIFYEVVSIILKLFRNSDEGAIDFSGNAEMLAFAMLYFCVSFGMQFRRVYFDMLLYCGLLFCAVFLFPHFTGIKVGGYGAMEDKGAAASCFLLICMTGVYQYCFCKERLRSFFYLAVTAVGFLALLVNQNIVSLWLMTAYLIAMPVALRPTAQMVKRNAQMFFLFGFMLSNMSLLTGYTTMILTELSYSLEHSVYLDLLLAAGGILFFHYWDEIPGGVDLERLVMRKMRRAYKGVLMAVGIIFVGILISSDRWCAAGDGMLGTAWKGFALPLTESAGQGESGFYFCFSEVGVIAGIFAVIFFIFMLGRMRRNYELDKPVTGILVLMSIVFMIQLLFWKPETNTLTIYFALLLFAAFQKEEKVKMTSIKIRREILKEGSTGKC